MADKKNIDELFRNTFKNLEAEAPAGSWENISDRLDRSKRRKRAAYYRWAGTAAAVVLAFIGGYYLQPGAGEASYYDPRQAPVVVEPGEDKSEPQYDAHSRSFITDVEEPAAGEKASSAAPPQKSHGKSTAERPGELAAAPTGFTHDEARKAAGIPLPDSIYKEVALPAPAEALATAAPAEPKQHDEKARHSLDSLRTVTAALPTNAELHASQAVSRAPGSFRISAHGGPALAFRNVQVSDIAFHNASPSGGGSSHVAQNIEKEELSTSLSAGFNFAYRGNNRLEYLAGVYLTNWQQSASGLLAANDYSNSLNNNFSYQESSSSVGSTRFSNATQPSDFTPVVGSDGSIEAYRLQPDVMQEFSFVEIPLGVNYYLVDQRKWSWGLQGGVSARILAGTQSRLVFVDGREVEIENPELNSMSFQLQAGTGVGYRLSNDLQINIMPLLRYGVSPVASTAEVTTYFHQIMIYSGLSFDF